jgi:hypothetical protein
MRIKTSIRKTVSGFILFAGLLTGAVSCKKDKDNSPAPPPPPAAQKIKEFKTGEEFVRFDYNAAGDVSKVTINSDENTGGNTFTYTVNYNAAKKITSLETPGEKIVPVYENNVLSRADIFENDVKIGYTTYTIENNLLKKATIYYGEDTEFIPVLEFIFTYNAAGNIAEMVTMAASNEPGHMERAGHVTYQYDQKSNPLYAQRDLLFLFWQGPSKNNIKVEEHFDADLQLEDKFVYDYQYNDNGLPKSGTLKQGLPGEPGTTSNVSFTYQ